jgi:hypothetical protein
MRATLALIAAIGLNAGAFACCAVSTLNRIVQFGAQTNIIVWDPVSKTEHFVRNAQFTTDAKDFGFIAPTPTKPTLSKASRGAFETLARLQPVTKSTSGASGDGGASGETDHHVGSTLPLIGRDGRLQVEVDVPGQPRRLDHAAQLRLAPHTARRRGLQRPGQGLGGRAQRLVGFLRATQLLRERAELRVTLLLDGRDLLLHLLQALAHRCERLQHLALGCG